RFLAFAEKDAADDFSATVKARQFFIENTSEEHPAEGSQIAFTPLVILRLCARGFTGLQHPARIGSAARRAQWIFIPRKRCARDKSSSERNAPRATAAREPEETDAAQHQHGAAGFRHNHQHEVAACPASVFDIEADWAAW